jgi:citrate lyase alpha subunit
MRGYIIFSVIALALSLWTMFMALPVIPKGHGVRVFLFTFNILMIAITLMFSPQADAYATEQSIKQDQQCMEAGFTQAQCDYIQERR